MSISVDSTDRRDPPRASTSALLRESAYFDGVVTREGDFNPFHDRGWRTLARQFARMIPRTRPLQLLDVGCGTGESRRLYIASCRRYVGVDVSGAALRQARRRFPESSWIRSDASRLPFSAEQFDVVAFSSVLHHIDDYRRPLGEARRVIRPGGFVFAFDPNLLHPAMALFRHPRSPLYSPQGVSPNERPLRPGALRAAFRAAGFTQVRQRCLADIPYRAVAPRVLNAMLGIYNTLDRLLGICGLGRCFGSFVLTVGKVPEVSSCVAEGEIPSASRESLCSK